MSNKKRFLVTGGTGFLGSHLVRKLVREGHFVRVTDNNFRGAKSRLDDIWSKIEFVEADIRDEAAVVKAAQNVHSILHLAFINGTEYFYKQPKLVLDVGVRGMLNVLVACEKNNIRDLVVASSSEVYHHPAQIPTDETVPMVIPDPLNPRYSYGGGKLISELLAINYGREGFDRVVIFRPHNVYGSNMGFEHVIPQLAVKLGAAIKEHPTGDVPLAIQGDGSHMRAFIHVKDFTDGLYRVIEQGKHLNIYHIGTMQEISIRQLIETMGKVLGRNIKILPGEAAAGGTDRRCPDISKLRQLGFSPSISLEEGLKESLDWYFANSPPAKTAV